MKILFYTGGLNRGGAERVISNLTNYLEIENQVIIMTDRNSQSKYKLNDKIQIYSLDNSDKVFRFKIINNFSRLNKIKHIIKDVKPDIIVSFLPLPSFRILYLKRKINIPIISSVRNDPNREYNNWIKKRIAISLYSKADGIVFQTEDAKRWFPEKIRNKSIVIANPLNEEFISEPFKGDREKIIVSVGRLAEQKNHLLLIDAFSKVLKKHPEYKLQIFGSGKLKEIIEKHIKDNNLINNVFLMGETDNVKEKIYKAKMFVLSSDYEGMPNSLMEAMALGLPCISTDCPIGGPKTLINNRTNGILTKVGDVEELAEAIDMLIVDNVLSNKISNEANKIVNILNPKTINEQWEEYIKKIAMENKK